MNRSTSLLAAALTLAALAFAPRAGAEGSREAAAELFDVGVKLFRDAEYARAARAFLDADADAANPEALKNAMVAARRAGDAQLLMTAAQRAASRDDAQIARLGREGVVEAAARLARVELSCAPAPCEISLDGRPASATTYALPGTHRLAATAAGRTRAERVVVCGAGVACRYLLEPLPDAPRTAPFAGPAIAPSGLPPTVFYVSAGVTAVVTAFFIGSSVDALSARGDLPDPPTTAQRDDLLGRAHRTDALLGGALLSGAVTVALGVWFVRFHDAKPGPPSARNRAMIVF